MLRILLISIVISVSLAFAPGYASEMASASTDSLTTGISGTAALQFVVPVGKCKTGIGRIGCPSTPVLVPRALLTTFEMSRDSSIDHTYPARLVVEQLTWRPAPRPPKWMLI